MQGLSVLQDVIGIAAALQQPRIHLGSPSLLAGAVRLDNQMAGGARPTTRTVEMYHLTKVQLLKHSEMPVPNKVHC